MFDISYFTEVTLNIKRPLYKSKINSNILEKCPKFVTSTSAILGTSPGTSSLYYERLEMKEFQHQDLDILTIFLKLLFYDFVKSIYNFNL